MLIFVIFVLVVFDINGALTTKSAKIRKECVRV